MGAAAFAEASFGFVMRRDYSAAKRRLKSEGSRERMSLCLPVKIYKPALTAPCIAPISLGATYTADEASRPARLAAAQAITTHTAAGRSLIDEAVKLS